MKPAYFLSDGYFTHAEVILSAPLVLAKFQIPKFAAVFEF